jgi:DnaJ-class molecular chaperone
MSGLVGVLLAEVKQECPDCGGMGTVLSLRSTAVPPPRMHCFACRGRGWVLSDIGRLLAEALKAGH